MSHAFLLSQSLGGKSGKNSLYKTPNQIGGIFTTIFLTALISCLNLFRLRGGNFQREMMWKVSWSVGIEKGSLHMFYIIALIQTGHTDIQLGANMSPGETGSYFKLEK